MSRKFRDTLDIVVISALMTAFASCLIIHTMRQKLEWVRLACDRQVYTSFQRGCVEGRDDLGGCRSVTDRLFREFKGMTDPEERTDADPKPDL